MEYQNGQPLLARAPAGAHRTHRERISRRQVKVPDGRHHRREEDPDHHHTTGILFAKRTSPPSLQQARTTKNSLNQAPRPNQKINSYHNTQVNDRSTNRMPTSDAHDRPKGRETGPMNRRMPLRELSGLAKA